MVDALRAALTGQKVRPASGEIFVNEAGNPWPLVPLSERWGVTLRRAAKDLFKPLPGIADLTDDQRTAKNRFLSIPARKLRAAFATLADRMGTKDRLVKAYMGHAPSDILGAHYQRIDLEALRTVSGIINGWREALKEGNAWKESGNIPELETKMC